MVVGYISRGRSNRFLVGSRRLAFSQYGIHARGNMTGIDTCDGSQPYSHSPIRDLLHTLKPMLSSANSAGVEWRL